MSVRVPVPVSVVFSFLDASSYPARDNNAIAAKSILSITNITFRGILVFHVIPRVKPASLMFGKYGIVLMFHERILETRKLDGIHVFPPSASCAIPPQT